MNLGRLSKPERALWHAFSRGEPVDLRGRRGQARTVRAEVIAALLLGAVPSEPIRAPALRLDGARVTGTLALGHSEVACPIRLRHCEFDSVIDLSGARTRDFDLEGSQLAGLTAPLAEIAGNLDLNSCDCSGQVVLTSAHVTGALGIEGSRLRYPGGVALLANRSVIDGDLIAPSACLEGELRLAATQVGGTVILDGAVIRGEGARRALDAENLSVGQSILARGGFTAEGEVRFAGMNAGHDLEFREAVLNNPGGNAIMAYGVHCGGFISLGGGCSVQGAVRLSYARAAGIFITQSRLSNPVGDAIRCRNAEVKTLIIGSGLKTEGAVDFRYSRFTVVRDDPSCWPQRLRLAGVSYDRLEPPLPAAERVRWLRLDDGGYVPENYETLAGMYRGQGDDAAARTVLLARERARRKQLRWYRKPWSLLQEITVGYGYRPLRAGAWLAVFLVLGSVVFGLHSPLPVPGAAHPPFNPFVYTLDLLVPLVNFGLRDAYACRGPEQWLTYLLIAVGWIFATTIAAGIARVLQRQ